MWNKRPEFTSWLLEVKEVNLESLPPWEEKKMFKDFMEDHNNAAAAAVNDTEGTKRRADKTTEVEVVEATMEVEYLKNELVEMRMLLDECEVEVEVVSGIGLKLCKAENERERLRKLDLDLQQSLVSLEDKRKRVDSATEKKLEALKSETSELSTLEVKLKEELDDLRAQKLEIVAEADRLKVEKAKFEAEWEHIHVKKGRVKKRSRVCKGRRSQMYLKDERDNINEERGRGAPHRGRARKGS